MYLTRCLHLPCPSCSVTTVGATEGYACVASDVFAFGVTLLLTLFGSSVAALMTHMAPLFAHSALLDQMVDHASGCLEHQQDAPLSETDPGRAGLAGVVQVQAVQMQLQVQDTAVA
jgi:hypothetical protein